MQTAPEHLGRLVRRLQHRHHRALDAGLAPLGLSLVQWSALREIDRHPGESQRRLAEHTVNSVQAFGALVQRLISAGLVVRAAGPGRKTVHTLTAEGKRLLGKGTTVMTRVMYLSFAPLSAEDRAELERLLTLVLDGRNPQPRDGRLRS
ncbi:MAG: MarR family winged helix-turn-helix transcriptional regulator [Polyangiaceae bacterium]